MTEGEPDSPNAAGDSETSSQTPPPLPTASEELERVQTRPVVPMPDLDDDHRKRYHEAVISEAETRAKLAEDNRELREKIAERVTWAVAVQVGIADLAFVVYGFANDWQIPEGAINAWLGATVIQVIALALVIVKSLFPGKPNS